MNIADANRVDLQPQRPSKTRSLQRRTSQSEKSGKPSIADPVTLSDMRSGKLSLYSQTGELNLRTEAGHSVTAKTSTIRLQLDLEIQRQTKTAYESYFSKLNISLNIEINTIETRVDFNSQGKRFSASDFLKSHSGVDFDSSIDIPEYFNVENTGQRMLDILTAGTEGDEFTDDWIEAKKSLVNKAYSEVTKMFGTLPQIVLDTQDYVLGKLDEMGD